MRAAGYLLLVSAALHVVGVALAGFSEAALLLAPVAVYVVLFAGLARGMMWVAWLAFVAMLVGSAGAIAELNVPSPLPAPVLWGILAADLAAAVLLFGAIWRGRPEGERGRDIVRDRR